MNIKINRIQKNGNTDAVFGELYLNGQFECLTLERFSKLIPEGTYRISFYFSPHNQLLVPLLQNVPQRDHIEIHPANYPAQLEGCITVGTTHNQDSISNSRFAFFQLMEKIHGQSDLQLTVVNS